MIVEIKELTAMLQNLRKVDGKWYLAKPEDSKANFLRQMRAVIIVLSNRGVVVEWR
jgi:hypothetical protein